jgi:hypothetical protein
MAGEEAGLGENLGCAAKEMAGEENGLGEKLVKAKVVKGAIEEKMAGEEAGLGENLGCKAKEAMAGAE